MGIVGLNVARNIFKSQKLDTVIIVCGVKYNFHSLPFFHFQFNSAARQLIELDKPSDGGGDSSEGPSSSSSAPQANGSQKATGEKKNSKKRHSFTSLTMSHKPSLAPPPQRHSMEISGPVLISSSNPTAAARIGELSGGLSSSAPSQVRHDEWIDTRAAYQSTIQPCEE